MKVREPNCYFRLMSLLLAGFTLMTPIGCGDAESTPGQFKQRNVRANGFVELPSVSESKQTQLPRVPINTFGDRPTTGNRQFVKESLESPTIGKRQLAEELRESLDKGDLSSAKEMLEALSASTPRSAERRSEAQNGNGQDSVAPVIRSLVKSPDEQYAFGIVSGEVVRANAGTLTEQLRLKARAANRLAWCGGKLIVIGGYQTFYEFFDSGVFRRHFEKPPFVPSRRVETFTIWMLNPENLQVEAGYTIHGDTIAFARDVLFAVVVTDPSHFDLIDLAKGERLSYHTLADFTGQLGSKDTNQTLEQARILDLNVSPNGKSINIAIAKSGATERYRIDREEEKLRWVAE